MQEIVEGRGSLRTDPRSLLDFWTLFFSLLFVPLLTQGNYSTAPVSIWVDPSFYKGWSMHT